MFGVYYFSFDNPKNGDYKFPLREMSKISDVEKIVPKTTLMLKRHRAVKFVQIQDAAKRSLNKKNGRGVLISAHTGYAYVIDNRGNRKGEWLRKD